jgi:hypothetical protein
MRFLVFLGTTLAILSCTKSNHPNSKTLPSNQSIEISCGTITMTPPNSLYNYTNVKFEANLPVDSAIKNLVWHFTKNTVAVLTSNSNPVEHIFNATNEGAGDYVATLTFQKSNGNSCQLEQSFQILKDDVCVPPSGISGPSIAYVGEETSPFSINSEDCAESSVAWDMNSDGVPEYNVQTADKIVHTYDQVGVFNITATVAANVNINETVLSKTIEIRNKACVNPFNNSPVANGESVEFAKPATQCGNISCEKTQRVCSNGNFDGDSAFTEDPATCAASVECQASYVWQASEYGACTGACKELNGTRPITNYVCKKTVSGITTQTSDNECVASIGAKPSGVTESCSVPVTDQTLNCLSCGPTPHNGSVTKWAASATCGTACTAQTRTCDNGVIPPFDPSYVYSSVASCPITQCPPVYTYSWKVSEFGACSAKQCGTQGLQTRNVACTRNDGAAVADSYCSTKKPDTTKICFARECYACNLPWGGHTAHGTTTTAYQASTVACGLTCSGQQRKCNDGVLSGTYSNKTCSVDTCTSSELTGSTCNAFMGTMISWKDSTTGQTCIGNLFGNLMVGDYLQIGGTHYVSNNIEPWDKATYRGSAKIVCGPTHDQNGQLQFTVESGTCKSNPKEPNLITAPVAAALIPSDCSPGPVEQQRFGGGTCAVYRQGTLGDMPLKGLFVQTGAKKYVAMGEYARSTEHLFSQSPGKIFTSGSLKITYNGETKELSSYCGNHDGTAPNNSTCSKSDSVVIGGVTFKMGVGARNSIDPKGYVPQYIGSFKNTAKREVWSQKTCGVVTLSSSLGFLPPPCP